MGEGDFDMQSWNDKSIIKKDFSLGRSVPIKKNSINYQVANCSENKTKQKHHSGCHGDLQKTKPQTGAGIILKWCEGRLSNSYLKPKINKHLQLNKGGLYNRKMIFLF